jgi:hypothetical protein
LVSSWRKIIGQGTVLAIILGEEASEFTPQWPGVFKRAHDDMAGIQIPEGSVVEGECSLHRK